MARWDDLVKKAGYAATQARFSQNERTETDAVVAGLLSSQATAYEENQQRKALYAKDENGQSRIRTLQQAAGLEGNQRYTDWYKLNGKAPSGFEIESRLLLKKEEAEADYKNVENGTKGYQTFLFDNYATDILRTSGYDIENPRWWRQRFDQGETGNPLDDTAFMTTLLSQCEAAWNMDGLIDTMTTAKLGTIAGTQVDGQTVGEIFAEQQGLVEAIGSWDEVIEKYKGGLLSQFNPVVYDENGKAIYYLHRDGVLYNVSDTGEGKYTAKAYYNEDGSLDRIFIGESEAGEWIQPLKAGFANGFLDILDLGAMAYSGLKALFGGTSFGDEYAAWKAFKASAPVFSQLFDDKTFAADTKIKNEDGSVDWDNIRRGGMNVVGNIGGMLLMMWITGGVSGIANAGKAAAKEGVEEGAEALVKQTVEDIAAQTISAATAKRVAGSLVKKSLKEMGLDQLGTQLLNAADDQIDDIIIAGLKKANSKVTADEIRKIIADKAAEAATYKMSTRVIAGEAVDVVYDATGKTVVTSLLQKGGSLKSVVKGITRSSDATIRAALKSPAAQAALKSMRGAQARYTAASIAQALVAVPSKLVSFNAGIPITSWAKTSGWANVIEKAAVNFLADGAYIVAEMEARKDETGMESGEILSKALGVAAINAAITVALSGGTDDVGAVNRWAQLTAPKTFAKAGQMLAGSADDVAQRLAKISKFNLGMRLLTNPAWNTALSWTADVIENTATLAGKMNMIQNGVYNPFPDLSNPDTVAMMIMSSYMSLNGNLLMGAEGMRTHSVMEWSGRIGQIYEATLDRIGRRYDAAAEIGDVDTMQRMLAMKKQMIGDVKQNLDNNMSPIEAQLEVLDKVHTIFSDNGEDSFITDEVGRIISKTKLDKLIALEHVIIGQFERRSQKMTDHTKAILGKGFGARLRTMVNRRLLGDDIIKKLDGKFENYKVSVAAGIDKALKDQINIFSSISDKNFSDLPRQGVQEFEEDIGRFVEFTTPEAKAAEALKNSQAADYDQRLADLEKAGKTTYSKTERKGKADSGKPFTPEQDAAIDAAYKSDKSRIINAKANAIIMTVKNTATDGDNGSRKVEAMRKVLDVLAKMSDSDNPAIIRLDDQGNYMLVKTGTELEYGNMLEAIRRWTIASRALLYSTDVKEVRTALNVLSPDVSNALKVMADIIVPLKPGTPPDFVKAVEAETIFSILDEFVKNGAMSKATAARIIRQDVNLRVASRTNNFGQGLAKIVDAMDNLQKLDDLMNVNRKSKSVVEQALGIVASIEGDPLLFAELKRGGIIDDTVFKNVGKKLNELKALNPTIQIQDVLATLGRLAGASSFDNDATRDAVATYFIKKYQLGEKLDVLYDEADSDVVAALAYRELLGGEWNRLPEKKLRDTIKKIATRIITQTALAKGNVIDDVRLKVETSRAVNEVVKTLVTRETQSPAARFLSGLIDNNFVSEADLNGYLSTLGYMRFNRATYTFEKTSRSAVASATVLKKIKSVDALMRDLRGLANNPAIQGTQKLKDLLDNSSVRDFARTSQYMTVEKTQQEIGSAFFNALKKPDSITAEELGSLVYREIGMMLASRVKTFDVPETLDKGQFNDAAKKIKFQLELDRFLQNVDLRVGDMELQDAIFKAVKNIRAQAQNDTLAVTEIIKLIDVESLESSYRKRIKADMQLANEYYYGGNTQNLLGTNEVVIDLTRIKPKDIATIEAKIFQMSASRHETSVNTEVVAREFGIDPSELVRRVRFMQKVLASAGENSLLRFNLGNEEERGQLTYLLENLGYEAVDYASPNKSGIPGMSFHKTAHRGFELVSKKEISQLRKTLSFSKGKATPAEKIDHLAKFFTTFGYITHIDENTVISPEMIYAIPIAMDGFGIEDVTSIRETVLDALKLGKISGKGGTALGTITSGPGVRGNTDVKLRNYLMLRSLQQVLDLSYGKNADLDKGDITDNEVSIESKERYDALVRFGWQFTDGYQAGEQVYYIKGYQPGVIPTDAVITDLVPGDLSPQNIREQITYLTSITYDHNSSATLTPADVALKDTILGKYKRVIEEFFADPKKKIETDVYDDKGPLQIAGGTVADVLKQLEAIVSGNIKSKQPLNLRALLLGRQLKLALAVSKDIDAKYKNLFGAKAEDYKRIERIMANDRVAAAIAEQFNDGKFDLNKLNGVIQATYNIPSKIMLEVDLREYNDRAFNLSNGEHLGGDVFAQLGARYNASDILKEGDIELIQDRIREIFVTSGFEDDYKIPESDPFDSFLSMLTLQKIDPITGEYHYGFSVDDIAMLTFEEIKQMEARFVAEFGQPYYQMILQKASQFENVYKNRAALNRATKLKELRYMIEKNPSVEVNSGLAYSTKDALGFEEAAADNRIASNDRFNSVNDRIKASSAYSRDADRDPLLAGYIDSVSRDVSQHISHPSNQQVVNVNNHISFGDMMNSVGQIYGILRNQGLQTQRGLMKIEDDEVAMRIAEEMFNQSTGVENQSEYSKYFFIKETKDAAGAPKYDIEYGQWHRGPDKQERFFSLYRRALKDYNELKENEKEVILVLEKNQFTEYKGFTAEDGSDQNGVFVRYVDMTQKDDAANGVMGFESFYRSAMLDLVAHGGSALANSKTKLEYQRALADVLTTDLTGYEVREIGVRRLEEMGIERDVAMGLFASINDYATQMMSGGDNAATVAFTNFALKDYLSLRHRVNNEQIHRAIETIQFGQSFKNLKPEVKNAFITMLKGMDKLSYADHRYVNSILENNTDFKPITVTNDDAGYQRMANILKIWMLRSPEMDAKDFIMRNSVDKTWTLEAMKQRRNTTPRTVISKNGKSYDLEDLFAKHIVVFEDSEAFFKGDESHLFQIGMSVYVNGKKVDVRFGRPESAGFVHADKDDVNMDLSEFNDWATKNGATSLLERYKSLRNAQKLMSKEDAADEMNAFIAKVKALDPNKQIVFITHNGEQAGNRGDIKWLQNYFAGTRADLKPLLDSSIDWYNDVRKPVLFADEPQPMGKETKRQSIEALTRYSNDPEIKKLLSVGLYHDADTDAELLARVVYKNIGEIFNVDKMKSGLLIKVEQIAKELGIQDLDVTKLSALLNFDGDAKLFKDNIKDTQNGRVVKEMLDLINYEQSTRERIFNLKQLRDDLDYWRGAYKPLLAALKNGNNVKLSKFFGYVVNKINQTAFDNPDLAAENLYQAIRTIVDALPEYKQEYVDSGITSLSKEGIVELFKDIIDSPENVINKLNNAKKLQVTFSMDEYKSAPEKTFMDSINNLAATNKSFMDMMQDARQYRNVNSVAYKLTKKVNTKGTNLFNSLIGSLLLPEGVVRQLANEMGTMFAANSMKPSDVRLKMKHHAFSDQLVDTAEEIFRDEMPIKISRSRIYSLANSYGFNTDIAGADGKVSHYGSGYIVVNLTGWKSMFGGADEAQAKELLGIAADGDVYTTVLRHPSDKVDTIHGYKVVIDYGDKSDTPRFRFNTVDIFSKHSGDFDGDHVMIFRPSTRIQKIFSTGLYDMVNSPYKALSDIVSHPDFFKAADNAAFFEVAEWLEKYFASKIGLDISTIYNAKDRYGAYQAQLLKHTEDIQTNFPEIIDKLRQLTEEQRILIVQGTWIKPYGDITKVDPNQTQQFIINNKYAIEVEKDGVKIANNKTLLTQQMINTLFQPFIVTRDTLSGMLQKFYLSNFEGKEYKNLDTSEMYYTPIKINSIMRTQIDLDIQNRGTDAVQFYQGMLLGHGIDAKIVNAFIKDGFEAEDVVRALRVHEDHIRNSDKFLNTFVKSVKDGYEPSDDIRYVKRASEIFNEMTGDAYRDAFILNKANVDQYSKFFRLIVDNVVADARKKSSNTELAPSTDPRLSLGEKYFIVDDTRAAEAEDAMAVNKAFMMDPENNLYRVVSVHAREGVRPPKAFHGMQQIKWDKERNVAFYVQRTQLAKTTGSLKFASVGNYNFAKGTVEDYANYGDMTSPDGKRILTKEIAMTISNAALEKLFKAPGTNEYELVVLTDKDGVKHNAVKAKIGVVEDGEDWSQDKEFKVDLLTFGYNRTSPESISLLNDAFFKIDENGDVVFDSRDVAQANQLHRQITEPDASGYNAVSLYHQLLILHTLNNIDRTHLSKEQNADLDLEIESKSRLGSYSSPLMMRKLRAIFNNKFYFRNAADKAAFARKIEADPFLRQLFSKSLYDMIYKTVETGIDATEKLTGTPDQSLKSKMSVRYDIRDMVDVLSNEGVMKSDLYLNMSDSQDQSAGYISMLSFVNFLLEPTGEFITSNKAKQMVANYTMNMSTGKRGSITTNFEPKNDAELKDTEGAMAILKGAHPKTAINSDPAVIDNRGFGIPMGEDGFVPRETSEYESYFANNLMGTTENNVRTPYRYNAEEGELRFNDKVARQVPRILLMLQASLADISDDDRVRLFNDEMPTAYSSYNSSKIFDVDKEGNIFYTFLSNYAKRLENIADVRSAIHDATGNARYFEMKEAAKYDGLKALTTAELERYTTDNIPDQKDTVPKFGLLDAYKDRVESQNKAFRESILQNKDINDVDGSYRYRNIADGDTKQTIQKYILGTQGLDETNAYRAEVSYALDRFHRVPRASYAELMQDLITLNRKLNTPDKVRRFQNYADLMSVLAALEIAKTDADIQYGKDKLKEYFGLSSVDQAMAKVKEYEAMHGYEANVYKNGLMQLAKRGADIAIETEQAVPNLFNIFFPFVKTNQAGDGKNDNNKQLMRWTVNSMFGYNKKPITIQEALATKSHNFFESFSLLADEIAHLEGLAEMSKHLLAANALSNRPLIEGAENAIERGLAEWSDKNKYDFETKRLFLKMHATRIPGFDPAKYTFQEGKSIYYTAYMELKDIRRALLKEYEDEGTPIKYRSVEDLYAKMDAKNVNPNDLISFNALIHIEEMLNDIRYDAINGSRPLADEVLASARATAISEGQTAFVTRFGQRVDPDSEFYSRPLSHIDTSYITKNAEYLLHGQNTHQRFAMAILTGKIYTMEDRLATHIDKNYFTEKVPSRVEKIFKQVSQVSTKLIMSSVPRIINRMVSFSATDWGIISVVAPEVVTKAGITMRELSGLLQSNGQSLFNVDPEYRAKHPDNNYLNRTHEYLSQIGANPIADKKYDLFNMDERVEAGTALNKYFDKTDKLFFMQTLWGRYALWLTLVEKFESGKPLYGTTYYRKEGIDALESPSAKAMAVVDDTLGGPGGFPLVAKRLSGFAMFTTFPLALLRYGVNGIRSSARLLKELSMGEADPDGLRQIGRSAMGTAGVYLITRALISAIAQMYDVDEEDEEEWRKESAYIDPIQTLINDRPVVIYGTSANPFENLAEMTVRPFTNEANDTFIKKIIGLLNVNVLSKLNPLVKIPGEVISGYDFFSTSPIKTNYTTEDNIARKLAAMFIGINGSNAMVESLKYSRLDTEEPGFIEALGKSFEAALLAELGNSKGYKAEQKNYYKALKMVTGYLAIERANNGTSYSGTSDYSSGDVYALSKEIKAAMDKEQKPSVVYGLIFQAIDNGASSSEIFNAIRNNSISGRIEQIGDKEAFYSMLDEKERLILRDAIAHENNNYSILREMLTSYGTSKTSSYYRPTTIKKHYNYSPWRDPSPRFIRYTNRQPYKKYKPYKKAEYKPKKYAKKESTALTKYTGKYGRKLPRILKLASPKPNTKFKGIGRKAVAPRKGVIKKHLDWRVKK